MSRNDCPYSFGGLQLNVPEPATASLLIAGLGLGVFYNRRR